MTQTYATKNTVDYRTCVQQELRLAKFSHGLWAGLFPFTNVFAVQTKNKDGGGRKLTITYKGNHVDVSMSDIDVNKLHHMEYANGSTSWNSLSLRYEDLVLQIRNLKIGKEMWETIKTRNLGADRVKETRLQTLIMDFENLKMSDNDNIDAYAVKLSGIASKSATLGEVMSEHNLVKKFLTSLPRYFIHIVVALDQVLDLKTNWFEDVVGRLKAYEERVKQEDKVNDSQEKLLYVRPEYPNYNNDLSEGRGRGSYSRGHGRGRGQGDGRGNSQNQDTLFQNALNETETMKLTLMRHNRKVCIMKKNIVHGGTIHGTIHVTVAATVPGQTLHQVIMHIPIRKNIPENDEEDEYGSDDTPILIARLETIRLLIALIAGKGWKIHHLEVKTDFLNVSQGKDCVEIKQERYARKILKEAGMDDCIANICLMELGIKLSKAEDEPEVEATQYRKMVGCLRYLLHTRPYLTYSVSVVSRYMQSPRTSHAR
ncbi:uncharacterized mitochondrial protein-like protein [Tanacetum coccineum]